MSCLIALFAGQVLAYENLALNGVPTMSSDPGYGAASNINDGNIENFAHTSNGSYEWIEIDLARISYLGSIEVVNRSGCCSERIAGANMIAMNAARGEIWKSAALTDTGLGGVYIFNNGGVGFDKVRYIRLESRSNNYLNIAEIRAFGLYMDAFNPVPSNNQAAVSPDNVVLQWNTGLDPNSPAAPNAMLTKHYLYFGNGPLDPNLTLIATIPAGNPVAATVSYPMGALSRDATYYWRVDECPGNLPAGSPGLIRGQVWSFATLPTYAMIDPANPKNTLAYENSDVTFTVAATNPFTLDSTGMTYAWYKEGNATVLSTTKSLAITGVTAANEGKYYCTVTVVSNGKARNSNLASLVIKKTIADFPFDGSVVDLVKGHTGTLNKGATYTTGYKNQGILLDGMDDYVNIQPAVFNDMLSTAVSLSFWANGGLALPVDNSVIHATDTSYKKLLNVSLAWNRDNSIYWEAGNISGVDQIVKAAQKAEYKGKWNHYLFTKDVDAGTMSIYINGELWLQGTNKTIPLAKPSMFLVGCGWSGTATTNHYPGVIDDLRIFNYAMTTLEAAHYYHDITGETVCAQPVPNDLTGDCRMDLADLALFAGQWLMCNWVPVTECP